jgi:hypothetical protein
VGPGIPGRYQSSAGGQTDIYVTEFPSGRDRQIVSTGTTGAAFAPVWRGNEILFLSEEGMIVVR